MVCTRLCHSRRFLRLQCACVVGSRALSGRLVAMAPSALAPPLSPVRSPWGPPHASCYLVIMPPH
jgi:hypothetical protein